MFPPVTTSIALNYNKNKPIFSTP